MASDIGPGYLAELGVPDPPPGGDDLQYETEGFIGQPTAPIAAEPGSSEKEYAHECLRGPDRGRK